MHAWKILMAVTVLLVLIMILSALPPINKPSTSSRQPNQLFVTKEDNLASAQEATIDVNGINIGGVNQSLIVFLTFIGTLVGILTSLFWMLIAWRVLTVFEKFSTTFDRLLQQKIVEEHEQSEEV